MCVCVCVCVCNSSSKKSAQLTNVVGKSKICVTVSNGKTKFLYLKLHANLQHNIIERETKKNYSVIAFKTKDDVR